MAQEAHRCLECNYLCSKCVDVCPNRANVAIAVPGFKDQFQTLHLDAYCNECGNCAQFCPWQGKPYQDKVTIFSLPEDFDNSRNPGFYLADGGELRVRQGGETYRLTIDAQSRIKDAPRCSQTCAASSAMSTPITTTCWGPSRSERITNKRRSKPCLF